MRRTLPLLLAVGLLSPQGAKAQVITSEVIELPGKTIEVAGLSRWTPEMIQDSMNVHAPGDSLHHHACAATLRFELGFAEAASLIMRQSDGSVYAFVPVIEPQDSAVVRHRDLPLDTTGSAAPWEPLVAWAKSDLNLLQRALAARIRSRGVGLPAEVPSGLGADSLKFRQILQFLENHSKADDAAAARRIITESRFQWDRVAAAAVLSGFDRDDSAWHALTSALLESRGTPHTVAAQVLVGFTRELPRPIDWKPAAPTLHAILNGSSLFDLHWVMDMLVKTGAGPELAEELLGGGGHAVLMYAGASHPIVRGPAHRFLRAVSSRDYGPDTTEWREWLTQLQAQP